MKKVRRRVRELETVEIMPEINVQKKTLAWFIGKMFNPEENIWVWIRRIANILTPVILIIVVIDLII